MIITKTITKEEKEILTGSIRFKINDAKNTSRGLQPDAMVVETYRYVEPVRADYFN